ncbi:unnamed protein product [Prunus armeniaca]
MHEDDKAKTSFIIERGTYCYKVMPFGLKNAEATYQRLVNKIFKEQIGKAIEVYVDDMLVKAPKSADHLKNLAKCPTQPSAQLSSEKSWGPNIRYSTRQKLSSIQKLATQNWIKLRPYYQAHRVIVMTDFPLRSILHSPDASQRLMKWAIELSQYDLLYRPKAAIKAQALADFVAEFTPSAEEDKLVNKKKESRRSVKPKGAGAGVVIITPDGTLLEQAITLGFPASNNEAEYEALLVGLRLAKELVIKKLVIYSDSQLITNQASSEYMAITLGFSTKH